MALTGPAAADDEELAPLWDIALVKVQGDVATARRDLLALAESGNTEAMRVVGEGMLTFYSRDERLFEPDFKAGMAWIERAAEGGNTYAMLQLIQIRSTGYFRIPHSLRPDVFPPDEEVADGDARLAWLRRATATGSLHAINSGGLHVLMDETYPDRPSEERRYAVDLATRRYAERLLAPQHRDALFARMGNPRRELERIFFAPRSWSEDTVRARVAFFDALATYPVVPADADYEPTPCEDLQAALIWEFSGLEPADREDAVACLRTRFIAWLETKAQGTLSPEDRAELEGALSPARRDEIALWVEGWLAGFNVANP